MTSLGTLSRPFRVGCIAARIFLVKPLLCYHILPYLSVIKYSSGGFVFPLLYVVLELHFVLSGQDFLPCRKPCLSLSSEECRRWEINSLNPLLSKVLSYFGRLTPKSWPVTTESSHDALRRVVDVANQNQIQEPARERGRQSQGRVDLFVESTRWRTLQPRSGSTASKKYKN